MNKPVSPELNTHHSVTPDEWRKLVFPQVLWSHHSQSELELINIYDYCRVSWSRSEWTNYIKGKSQMLAGVSVFSVQCAKGTIIPHLSLNKRGLIAYQNRCNTKSSDQLWINYSAQIKSFVLLLLFLYLLLFVLWFRIQIQLKYF